MPESRQTIPETKARQGVVVGPMRYVLRISVLLAILAMIVAYVMIRA